MKDIGVRIALCAAIVVTGVVVARTAVDVAATPPSLQRVVRPDVVSIVRAGPSAFLADAASVAGTLGIESRSVAAAMLGECLREEGGRTCTPLVVDLEEIDPFDGLLPLIAADAVSDRSLEAGILRSCEVAPRENWLVLTRLRLSEDVPEPWGDRLASCLTADAAAAMSLHASRLEIARLYVDAPDLRPFLGEVAETAGADGEDFVDEISRLAR